MQHICEKTNYEESQIAVDLPEVRGVGKYEYETKYSLSTLNSRGLLYELSSKCQRDPDFPEAIIRSFYFDTPDWAFLREKIGSDYLKTKVRLRWYQDVESSAQDSAVFLEVKSRVGSQREKRRLLFPWTGEELASRGMDLELTRKVQELLPCFGIVLPGNLVPAFEVRYHRHRFIDPFSKMRVSLDSKIHAPLIHSSRGQLGFDRELPCSILEIKGREGSLPDHLSHIVRHGLRKTSFSKYFECSKILLQFDP